MTPFGDSEQTTEGMQIHNQPQISIGSPSCSPDMCDDLILYTSKFDQIPSIVK